MTWKLSERRLVCVGVLQGLEVEVQRLINRHKADLEAAHDRADEQVKVALEGAKVEHDKQMQALRDRMRQVRTRGLRQPFIAYEINLGSSAVQTLLPTCRSVSTGQCMLEIVETYVWLVFLMPQQQDEVIECERAAAASRLCEASERWEAQLQASRMRLAADNDLKVGTLAEFTN
jgi:hypothetical protein